MPNDTSTTTQTPTIVAVTGEDDRYRAVRSRATALAAGGRGTVILYDLDAGGLFASPVPTAWSGEGERELTNEEAGPRDRLDPDELDTAGRSRVADQVRQLRSMGVDAWAWLPTTKDAADLAAYAERQGASLVLVPPDLEQPNLIDRVAGATGAGEAEQQSPIPFETVS
jgi:hypothetical protein